MFPGGAAYYAAIGRIALIIVSTGGLALSTTQKTMTIVTILLPLLVYLAGFRLYSCRMVSILAKCLCILSGTVWYLLVFGVVDRLMAVCSPGHTMLFGAKRQFYFLGLSLMVVLAFSILSFTIMLVLLPDAILALLKSAKFLDILLLY